MKVRLTLWVSVLFLVSLQACNLRTDQSNLQDLALTITAQAQAIEATARAAIETPAAAEPASEVQAKLTADTNCRSGPSKDYDLVLKMPSGASAQVIGKNTPDNYWIISNPAGGSCWLWGQNAVISGDTGSLPEYPPPPKPVTKNPQSQQPEPPTATPETLVIPQILVVTETVPDEEVTYPDNLANLAWNRTCDGGMATDGYTPIWIEKVTLTWEDVATETGYTVYKNNIQLPNIPENSTQYNMTMRYNQGTGGPLWTKFGVEAFNSGGTSDRSVVEVPNCP